MIRLLNFLASPYYMEIECLVDDLELVPAGSPEAQEHLYSIRVWRSQKAMEEEKKRDALAFQQAFLKRFRKYAHVDHKELQVDAVELSLF